jgi:energy-converting hydrogenase Eha subunit A
MGNVTSSAICCLGVIGAGLVAVWHYTSTNALTITGGEGAGMGAAAGAVAAILTGILSYALIAAGILPDPEVVMQEMLESMPEDQRAMAERFGGVGTGPVGWIINAVIYAVIGAIGGAIGAALFKKGPITPEEPGH